MTKPVGIILINYQDYGERFLSACRACLRTQSYPAELIKVYIVDNASTEKSLAYLKQFYPEAVILPRSDGNYAAANNLGFQTAIQNGCEYLVGVNMDTEMTPDWLKELVEALDNNPAAGLAQSKILLYPKTEIERAQPRINSLGNLIHFLGFGFTDGYGQPDREILGYPEIKGYASGCSLMIRPEIFKKIGGYNETYYMYHDDLELSLKVKLIGYKIILAPRSVIYHKYDFKRSTKMIYYMERNRYLTLLIFYPWYLLILIGLAGVLMDIGLLGYSLIGGWLKEELKIYGYFCRRKNYQAICRERNRIQGFKAVSFNKLADNFVGKIEFQEVANPILRYIVNPLFNLYWQIIRWLI